MSPPPRHDRRLATDTPPRAVAIILARAGSKGLPGKNAAPIAGRPCLAWTVRAALGAKSVVATFVSTDGPALARIAREHGAIALERPAPLAGDRATVDDAARSALAQIEAALGQPLRDDAPIVLLYGNVPVRPRGLIDRAVTLLTTSGADSVQSYQPVGKNHPWWTARVDPTTGLVRPWQGRTLNHGVFRRQDLPPAFIPDGGVIALTRRALTLSIRGVPKGPHAFFGKDRRGLLNPEGSVVDIDTATDLLVAQATLSANLRADRAPARSAGGRR